MQLVLDLSLARMDGISLLQDCRDKGLTLPVLILTARDSWADKVACIRAGADDYMTKNYIVSGHGTSSLLNLPGAPRTVLGTVRFAL